MKAGALRSAHVQNFKAIRDSGAVKLTPLTVLIGNNGSGKSSLLEALESYQTVATQGLDIAMQQWRGFEHVRNNAAPTIWTPAIWGGCASATRSASTSSIRRDAARSKPA